MNASAPDPQSAAALARAAAVRLMAFDVDGTLTDGGIHISAQGEAFKRFSVRDGLGLVLLRDNGVRVAIVTGRSSAIVEQRARELGIEEVIQGVADKSQAMRSLAERHRLRQLKPRLRTSVVGRDLRLLLRLHRQHRRRHHG